MKTAMKKQPKKARWLCGILYPADNERHKKALNLILKKYNSLAICHDKDVYLFDELDENGELLHQAGELKKAHYHFVVRFENSRYISGFAKELDIEENIVQVCGSFKATVIYCTHRDEPFKHQYDITDFKGYLVPQAIKILDKPQEQGDMVADIVEFINEHPGASMQQVFAWCNTFGYYSTLLRNYGLIKDIFYEVKANKNTYERSKKQ